jgi:hypothetical protein
VRTIEDGVEFLRQAFNVQTEKPSLNSLEGLFSSIEFK